MSLLTHNRRGLVVGSRSRALRYLPLAAFLVDSIALAVAGLLARLSDDQAEVLVNDTLGAVAPLLLLGWLIAIRLLGGYHPDLFGVGLDEYKLTMRASVLTAGLVGVGCYVATIPLSRAYFVLVFAAGIPLLILGRFLLRRLLYAARVHGSMRHRVIIAGTPAHVDEIAAVLRRETWLGYEVVGALVADETLTRTEGDVTVVDSPDQVLACVEATAADVILLAGGALDSSEQLRRIVWELEEHHVRVIVAPSVTNISAERVKIRPMGGLPLVHIEKPRARRATRRGKRAFDLVGSLSLLALLAPALLLAALCVRLDDGGPVLFRQLRLGHDGRTFTCLKFRSMVPDAELLLVDLVDRGEEINGLFKLRDDPRVTRPGQFLRRFSLDELPQLCNVVRGEMSLVGPRPALPSELAVHGPLTERRLRVRPGLTGLWQVSGRADLSSVESLRLDLYYVDNWSMLQDLTILVRTAGAVVRGRGAY